MLENFFLALKASMRSPRRSMRVVSFKVSSLFEYGNKPTPSIILVKSVFERPQALILMTNCHVQGLDSKAVHSIPNVVLSKFYRLVASHFYPYLLNFLLFNI